MQNCDEFIFLLCCACAGSLSLAADSEGGSSQPGFLHRPHPNLASSSGHTPNWLPAQATPPPGFLPRLHPHLASFPGYHRQGQQRGQSPSAPRCSSGLGHTSACLTQLPACLLPPKLLSPVEWLDLGVDCCSEGPLATA